MAVEDEIYNRLVKWSRRTYRQRDDLISFEYEVQHAGLGKLVQEMMAEAWDAGFDIGSDFEAYLARGVSLSEMPDTTNPYRKTNS